MTRVQYSQRLEAISESIIVGIKKSPIGALSHTDVLDRLSLVYSNDEIEFVINRLLISDILINTMIGYRTSERKSFTSFKDIYFTTSIPPSQSESDYFSEEELTSLHGKIDEILKRISEMEFKVQNGQEIIFNEVDELRNLPSLRKKTWNEIVKGKIINMAISKIADPAFFEWLHKELTGSRFTLLN